MLLTIDDLASPHSDPALSDNYVFAGWYCRSLIREQNRWCFWLIRFWSYTHFRCPDYHWQGRVLKPKVQTLIALVFTMPRKMSVLFHRIHIMLVFTGAPLLPWAFCVRAGDSQIPKYKNKHKHKDKTQTIYNTNQTIWLARMVAFQLLVRQKTKIGWK